MGIRRLEIEQCRQSNRVLWSPLSLLQGMRPGASSLTSGQTSVQQNMDEDIHMSRSLTNQGKRRADSVAAAREMVLFCCGFHIQRYQAVMPGRQTRNCNSGQVRTKAWLWHMWDFPNVFLETSNQWQKASSPCMLQIKQMHFEWHGMRKAAMIFFFLFNAD